MKKLFYLLTISILGSCFILSCSPNKSTTTKESAVATPHKTIITDDYELVLPKKQEHLLILFPCFPCTAERTKAEFNIIESATKEGIAVLMMNFNKHLWLSKNEKNDLENMLIQAKKNYKLNTKNTFIGGFSSGGNISLLLTNHLQSNNSIIKPKGVFIVDSPIDLLGLYENALKNIKKNYSEAAVEESKWIVSNFNEEFGVGDSSFRNYEAKSPYISKTHSLTNLSNMKNLRMRFYSEPDTLWWKENRKTEYEDTNAYYIEQLTKDLSEKYGNTTIEYITTKNKGYRSNGERHPHSWSIVDKKELINWILEE